MAMMTILVMMTIDHGYMTGSDSVVVYAAPPATGPRSFQLHPQPSKCCGRFSRTGAVAVAVTTTYSSARVYLQAAVVV